MYIDKGVSSCCRWPMAAQYTLDVFLVYTKVGAHPSVVCSLVVF